jgi:cysteinyl-tRNA synthetase
MVLKIYNTLTRKKEIFKSIKKGEVGIYGCGPTVYWYQHIGNIYRYIFEDVLVRTLLFNNYKVNHVINITDVGHLTSDADEGEDKMLKAIKREGMELSEDSMLKIAKKYTDVFKEDLWKVNIIKPDYWPKATEHIKEQIDLIKRLEKNGCTYNTDVGVIFDTSKYKDYGKLANLNVKELKAGSRVKVDNERKNKSDFALWITNQPNHIMLWDSPWGKGFPGWHIECSAMSMKYLGEQFDIHTGGEEHIPVHHTNEIAQSECATKKKPWVKFWVHLRWLVINGGKMSKSLGNVYLLSELEEKGYKPLEFRYFCLGGHYRKNLNFTLENLDNAKNSYGRLKNITLELKEDKKINKEYIEEFENAINDDLDMPKALQVLWKLVRDDKAEGKYQTIKKMDEVFGLKLLEKEKIEIPAEVKKLAEERETARKNKEWKKSDELRDKINKLGFVINDTPNGWEIKRL